MTPLLPLVIAVWGVDVGWRPLPDRGIEYIIQVAPEELAGLTEGAVLAVSDVPPDLPPIRSYRIVVGRGPVPRELPSPAFQSAATGNGGDAPARPEKKPEDTYTNPTLAGRLPPVPGSQPAVALFPVEEESTGQRSSPRASSGGQTGQGPPKSTATTQPDHGENGRSQSSVSDGDKRPRDQTMAEEDAALEQSTPASSGQTVPIILVLISATTSAGLIFSIWTVLDYRRKYLRLLAQYQALGGDSGNAISLP